MTALSLASVEAYLRARAGADWPAQVSTQRGQVTPEMLARGKGRMIILSRNPGPGLTLEQMFDRVIVTIRSVGLQGSYDDAEELAGNTDRWMLSPGNVQVGGAFALFVNRVGSEPVPVMTDKARRTHFQCGYVIPVSSGL